MLRRKISKTKGMFVKPSIIRFVLTWELEGKGVRDRPGENPKGWNNWL